MAEQTPTFVYQEIFKAFQQFAKPIMTAKAEPSAMILVIPWQFDAKYPAGAVVTRGGQLTAQELIVCAKQLRVMADKLYEMLAVMAGQTVRRAGDAEQGTVEGRTALAEEEEKGQAQAQRARDEWEDNSRE